MTNSTLDRTGAGRFTYGGFPSVSLYTSDFDDTINVQSTSSVTWINAGQGNDMITVGSASDASSTLDGIEGPLIVNGGGGTDLLLIKDLGTNASRTYTVTDTTLVRAGDPPISYSAIANLTLIGGGGGNTILVRSTKDGTQTSVKAGAGDDIITVSSGPENPGRLDDIQGPLTIDGQGGTNRIFLDDRGPPFAHQYDLQEGYVQRAGIARITTSNYALRMIRGPLLAGGVPGNLFNVLGNAPGAELAIDGGDGYDEVVIAASPISTSELQLTNVEALEISGGTLNVDSVL